MKHTHDIIGSRCVVLSPLDRVDAARHIVQKHELKATIQNIPALAMAEICLHHQHIQSDQAWKDSAISPLLILVHAREIPHVDQMIVSLQKYLPNARVFELRNGRLENIENTGAVVDTLQEPPIVHSESVDADELSMLLDETPHEVEE